MMGVAPTRRWPPAVALVTGFLMVFVALPNPLKIPNQNPGATAELAPVPGNEEQASQQGNFGETGLATSDTLGADPALPNLPPLPPGQEVPVDKECVGDPPRQTEDPLSPPCVPYFSGENGGETWAGVNREEITVVFYNDQGIEADMNQPYKPSDDDEGQGDYERVNLVKTIKAHLRYFQSKFQTYGRRVRVWATASGNQSSDQRRRDGLRDAFKYKPFGTVFLGDDAQSYFAQMAEARVVSFGLNFDVPRSYYEDNAPYVWSFVSDQETEAGWSASFICRSLLGRKGPGDRSSLPAAFTKDLTLQGKPRRIGFIWHRDASFRGPSGDQLAALLKAELRRQCGFTFDAERSFTGNAGAGSREAPSIISDFKTAGITTVVCYCTPVQPEVSVRTMQTAATGADYHPEWYWDHASAMDRPVWQQLYGSRDHNSFGVSYFWRQPAFREQMHYRAYQQATKDGSVPNVRFNFTIYHLMLNLFTAIQAAGQTLNPETVQRGMWTFKFLRHSYPWLPTGGYGADTPGTYTFMDTAMAWWWDPNGKPPGGKEAEGCQRVANDGTRYAGPDGVAAGIAPAWPLSDALIAGARDSGPCSEDTRKIQDPQPGDVH